MNAVLQDIVDFHEKQPLQPKLMRQLYQAVSASRLLGVEISVPEALEQTAFKWCAFHLLPSPGCIMW